MTHSGLSPIIGFDVNLGRIFAVSILIILAPLASAAADTSCFYASKKDKGDVVIFDDCGQADETGFVLSPDHKENIHFGDDNLACLAFSSENAFWVHKNGKSIRTLFYDAWCDDFEDGLAIGKVEDREVYIDSDLNVILDPGFDSLSHFRYDFAAVCNGPFRYEQHGEHTFRKGGKCGLINRSGEVVIEPRYPSENWEVFRDYRNSHNECPVPPIQDEASAICHAKRHAKHNDHTDNWIRHSVTSDGERWSIDFLESNGSGYEFTMHIGAAKADLRSIWKGDFFGNATDR